MVFIYVHDLSHFNYLFHMFFIVTVKGPSVKNAPFLFAYYIVDDITYNRTNGMYDSEIFTAEKNKDFSKAYAAKKNVQD